MWTYILKPDYDEYISHYSFLEEFKEKLILLETNNAYFLPRLMYVNYPHELLKIYIGKNNLDPHIINIKSKGKLRPYQEPCMDFLLNRYDTLGYINGIGKMRPGYGKTVVAVWLAAKLKLKTMIIIDSSSLLEQWILAIINFTNLTSDDIGIVQGKHNGLHKPIVISMCQSLLSKLKKDPTKTINEIDSNRFGLVIYDEVHATSSSEKFSNISVLFRTKNIIGLSATPFQTSYHEILMKNTIGNVIYETKDYELIPEYYMNFYNSGLGKRYNGIMHQLNDYVKKKALYNKIICDSPKFLELVIKNIKDLYDEGHNIIIICMTEKQIKLISDELTKINLVNRQFYGKEREIDKSNDRIIVATYSYTGKGFDMNRLSALVLACPLSGKKSLIQVIGRILRSNENKLQPKVIDFIDMAFPTLTMPEINRKKNVVSTEFINCKIIENHFE